MDFYVAKSYQSLEPIEEPYKKGDKMYCKVRMKNGSAKEVRAYTEKEYKKMYAEAPVHGRTSSQPQAHVVRKILGFDDGYVIIFNGGAKFEPFFEQSNARYHRMWGWYIPSTEVVPVLPEGVTAICLPWERVGNPDGTLLPEEEVIKEVRKVRVGR